MTFHFMSLLTVALLMLHASVLSLQFIDFPNVQSNVLWRFWLTINVPNELYSSCSLIKDSKTHSISSVPLPHTANCIVSLLASLCGPLYSGEEIIYMVSVS